MDKLQPEDPRRIGPYWLEGRLGSGGMGRVYLGRSPGGRRVAIKEIRPELAESANFRARFAHEVSAARKVSGIFTASVVDADVDGPVPWLATSFVPGPSLADAVAHAGPLSPASVRRLAAGLAEGLKAIHSAGVVHRDLKPSNVILAEDGPRLIDFGISRSAEMSSLTCTGTVVGSPGFMSPEQAEGLKVGPPSDIFSLGAVLTFAATGEGPFGEGTTTALLYRVVHDEPKTDGLPDEIRPFIERCLAKDPRHRPTAAQLLSELSTVPPAAPGPLRPAFRPVPGAGGSVRGPDGGVKGEEPLRHSATERQASPGSPPGGAAAWEPTATMRDLYPPVERRMPGPERVERRMPERQRRRRSRRTWLFVLGAAVMLAGAGAGALVAVRMGHEPAGTPPASSSSGQPKPSAQPPGAATMAALGSYVSQSASVRPTVQPAIDGVLSCKESPASGEATLKQAISVRQQILNGLRALSPAGLPNGAQLISTLAAAMQNSVNADWGYLNWMYAFEASTQNPCGWMKDSNYQDGQNDSVKATSDKNSFLSMWNPIAPRYGQRTYSSTDF